MFNKPVKEINAQDIEDLLNQSVPESLILDYKEVSPSYDDRAKEDFLKDFTAMANREGGFLIYGISEKKDSEGKNTNTPGEIFLLKESHLSVFEAKISSWLRDSVEPRILNYEYQQVEGASGGWVVVVKVPKCWNGPCAHKAGEGSYRFYSRNGTHNNPMNLQTVGESFLMSADMDRRLKDFRFSSISGLLNENRPVTMERRASAILHFIPVESLTGKLQINWRFSVGDEIFSIGSFRGNSELEYNFDGPFNWRGTTKASVTRFCQFYRSGAIEAVDTSFFAQRDSNRSSNPNQNLFLVSRFEREAIRASEAYLTCLKKQGISSPVFVLVSLLGIKNFVLYLNDIRFYDRDPIIDRNDLFFPEVIFSLENLDSQSIATSFRSIFDAIWNSFGIHAALSFDEQGVWRELP